MAENVKIPGIEGEWVETAYENLSDRYVIISEGRISTCISDARYYTPVPPDWRVLPEGEELDKAVARVMFPYEVWLMLPPFSTDINTATSHVIDRMRERGYECELRIGNEGGCANFTSDKGAYNWQDGEHALALSICKAALLAMETEGKT